MPHDPAPDDDLDLDAREAARVRRRDHDADAERRDLVRPGMGKVFKQITDSWGRDVDEHDARARKATRRHS